MRKDIKTLAEYMEAVNYGLSKKEREWLDGRKITGFVKKENCKKENGL